MSRKRPGDQCPIVPTPAWVSRDPIKARRSSTWSGPWRRWDLSGRPRPVLVSTTTFYGKNSQSLTHKIVLKYLYRCEIWQASQQHCYRDGCQFSEWSDRFKDKFRSLGLRGRSCDRLATLSDIRRGPCRYLKADWDAVTDQNWVAVYTPEMGLNRVDTGIIGSIPCRFHLLSVSIIIFYHTGFHIESSAVITRSKIPRYFMQHWFDRNRI